MAPCRCHNGRWSTLVEAVRMSVRHERFTILVRRMLGGSVRKSLSSSNKDVFAAREAAGTWNIRLGRRDVDARWARLNALTKVLHSNRGPQKP